MSPADRLRAVLAKPGVLVMPGCFDALSAKLVERADFAATFMGGFAVSGTRLGAPDAGLISYAEMVDQGRDICAAVSIPVFGDGDTGYGNAINVRRTVRGFAQRVLAARNRRDAGVSPEGPRFDDHMYHPSPAVGTAICRRDDRLRAA